MTRRFALVAALALACASHAYVLIDDFTVGEHHGRVDWPNNRFAYEEGGLDKNHSILGRRQTVLNVHMNFDQVPLFVDVADGRATVSYSSHEMATTFQIQNFSLDGSTVDLSAESRFMIDLESADPPGRWADQWSLFVIDSQGVDAGNGNWLLRQGGIYFERSDFSRAIDWRRVRHFEFRQEFSSFNPPLSYTTTLVYAVPEPVMLLALAPLLVVASRRRTRP